MEYTATMTLKRCVDVHLLDLSVSLPTYERSVPLHLIVLYSISMTSVIGYCYVLMIHVGFVNAGTRIT